MDPRDRARFGWASDLQTFVDAEPAEVHSQLLSFIKDASPEQMRVWMKAIPWLQDESRVTVELDQRAAEYATILEYELPLEFRRPDVIVLENGVIVVVELKSKAEPTQADLDQVAAYARDLRAYHRECHNRPVHALLVPSRAKGKIVERDGVQVVPPSLLAQTLLQLSRAQSEAGPISRESFLRADAYSPLPTLVRAARELFHSGTLVRIDRARAATEPALRAISEIAKEAAKEKNRRLVLLSGLPGSGKTLVGLQLVHAHFLDELSVERRSGKPTSPAVFLSGNASLVAVLQDALKGAGGGGRTFVRSVKGYVKEFSNSGAVPPHHVLVFDEAQRAWDAEAVAEKQDGVRGFSEPELFIQFAERVPEWCVVVALIGTGQEIHTGEEGGVALWRDAIEGSKRKHEWTIHTPPNLAPAFERGSSRLSVERALNLDIELRYHATNHLHEFVGKLLSGASAEECAELAERINREGARLFLTRELETAKQYVSDRYRDFPAARYGIVGSSRDKYIAEHGPELPAVTRFDVAKWFNGDRTDRRSSCEFQIAASEFACQGLELDFALVWWGKDLLRNGSAWSIENSTRYKAKGRVKDPMKLRLNAYRVLLTRGRDGFAVYLPKDALFDETAEFLTRAGLREQTQSR